SPKMGDLGIEQRILIVISSIIEHRYGMSRLLVRKQSSIEGLLRGPGRIVEVWKVSLARFAGGPSIVMATRPLRSAVPPEASRSRGAAFYGARRRCADHSMVRTMSPHRPILMRRGQALRRGRHMADTKALFTQRFEAARAALTAGNEPAA